MTSHYTTDALERLFQERYGLVVGVACQYAPSMDLVDDIVQQVYIDFVHGTTAKNWDRDQDIIPLLYRITKAKAQFQWRRRRRQALAVDAVTERLENAVFTKHENESQEETADRLRALEHCLSRLPARSRQIVERHYFEGVSIKKIGEAESMTLPTVYRFFRQMRLKLKECIQKTTGEKR